MQGRALLFDVGNTRLKWGVWDGQRIVRSGYVAHETLQQAGLAALATRLPRRVDSAWVSNVAGTTFGTRLRAFLEAHCAVDAHFVCAAKTAFGITNGYRQPRRLGVDRWVAMIAARATSKAALCVVDAGTTVTIDALDRDGVHLGGQILPGYHLMARSLKSDAYGIRGMPIRGADPGTGMALLARGTEKGVQAGALNAICGAIERTVRILRAAGYRPRIVLTGGGAAPILNQLGGNADHRPQLVLEGLAVMLQENG